MAAMDREAPSMRLGQLDEYGTSQQEYGTFSLSGRQHRQAQHPMS